MEKKKYKRKNIKEKEKNYYDISRNGGLLLTHVNKYRLLHNKKENVYFSSGRQQQIFDCKSYFVGLHEGK